MQILAFYLQSAPASNNPLGSLFLPIAMLAIMYFVIFLPMQRQKKAQAQMLASLEAGTEVLTTGGILGTIVSISGDTLISRQTGQRKTPDDARGHRQCDERSRRNGRKEVNHSHDQQH